jgi:phosphonate transport system substrate-binding protein
MDETRKYSLMTKIIRLLIILFTIPWFTACGGLKISSPTVTPAATLTPVPEATTTREPPGMMENPLRIGYISEGLDPSLIASAEEVARRLSAASGYVVESQIFTNYPDLLTAMFNEQVHMAWLPPFTYMLANQNSFAQAVLLTNHFGVYQYGTQFIANRSSGFTPFFDPQQNISTATSSLALQQFQGKRPCWVEPTSASGYILPIGLLVENNLQFQEGVLAQTHTAVIRSLYIGGICDFGATFSISGDPRTSSNVQDDLVDVMDQVVIIWQSDAIIPNLNLSIHPSIPQEVKEDLLVAWLVLNQSEEGKQLISTAANYEIADLMIVDDTLYDPLRKYTSFSGTALEDLIGK